jgi:transposase
MTDHTPISKVSRLEVITTGARRRWTLEEKQRIVAESEGGRRMVSATARLHGLSASQLFTWRRLAREGRLAGDGSAMVFAQAVIACEAAALGPAQYPEPAEASKRTPSALPLPLAAGRIEIVLANDRRVIVCHDVDTTVLARVIGVLERQ